MASGSLNNGFNTVYFTYDSGNQRGRLPDLDHGFGVDFPGPASQTFPCSNPPATEAQLCAQLATADGNTPSGFVVYLTPADNSWHCRRLKRQTDFAFTTENCVTIGDVYVYKERGL